MIFLCLSVAAPGKLLAAQDPFFHRVEIGKGKFQLDDFNVT